MRLARPLSTCLLLFCLVSLGWMWTRMAAAAAVDLSQHDDKVARA